MHQGAAELIELLDLAPHPEGGFYRETHRAAPAAAGRSAATAIYFLVVDGSPSTLHRVDADEVFHHYAGDSVEQLVIGAASPAGERRWLGTDWASGQRPQAVVPAGTWQGCRVTASGGWALLGCTVAPGFEFGGFELADDATIAELTRAAPEHGPLIDQLRPSAR